MKDRLFLEFVLARQPTQSQLDRLLSVWDIEADVFERTCALLVDMGYVGEGTAERR